MVVPTKSAEGWPWKLGSQTSFLFLGVKIYMRGKRRRGKKCVHVVVGGWLVYMGGYSIASESLRDHKSYVFVEQQKLRKRKGALNGTEAK